MALNIGNFTLFSFMGHDCLEVKQGEPLKTFAYPSTIIKNMFNY